MAEYGISETEYKIIREQIDRRMKMREEFLKQRTDPYRHAEGSGGYVFDEAMQRYTSMKATQVEYFAFNRRTILMGILLYSPFFIVGTACYFQRAAVEEKIRSGQLRYKDRPFKLC